MTSRSKFGIGVIQVGATVAILGGLAGMAMASGTPGPSIVGSVATSSDQAPGDIPGPCDETENAAKPECGGTG